MAEDETSGLPARTGRITKTDAKRRKSGRQKREELRARRIEKARANVQSAEDACVRPELWGNRPFPRDSIPADQNALLHDNTYSPRPLFYIDLTFHCADCGQEQLWTARAQKWWYEIAKGKIGSRAKYCRPCRRKRQALRAMARIRHYEGLVGKYGHAEAARRLRMAPLTLDQALKVEHGRIARAQAAARRHTLAGEQRPKMRKNRGNHED